MVIFCNTAVAAMAGCNTVATTGRNDGWERGGGAARVTMDHKGNQLGVGKHPLPSTEPGRSQPLAAFPVVHRSPTSAAGCSGRGYVSTAAAAP